MQTVKINSFHVIGISVKTTNKNQQSAQDIGALWGQFMQEQILDKIPNKVDNTVYSIYTDYEGDYTQPYTTVLGCKVSSLDDIPEGMVGKTFEGGSYTKFVSKGDLTQGVVFQDWLKIWNSGLNRNYAADFEVYGERAMNPNDAEVDIFVGVN